ncbi:DNA-binding transcriptional regulator, LysR family [Rhodoferax sp. OV413]|uniref:LysR substrate-binding domain-containing protein n=1 Tax=Rhodoferax sp. OV413 TaxID=1855285 RepID=UPI00088205D6|nr:LysR substrate-binding domain-containing protein [Rhodoferax sp. OV413]SDP55990.1 DNA-binding transcriptional regulator, LysR family [Rhodoferax sp. OV413]
MELRHLRYFVAVAEQGNVSRAAQKLFIAQPALSTQIRQLEEEVGAPLLVRVPRGVQLTAAGTAFLEDARAILARVQQATVHARAHGVQERSVRIGLVPSATHSLLPGLLQRLQQAGMGTQLQVREMISSQQLKAMQNDEIDIGLARPAEPLQDDAYVHMAAQITDPYCLALPAQHPLAAEPGVVALKQVAHAEFVAFSRYQDPAYFDRTVALCMEAGFSPHMRHEAGQFISVLALVGSGLGVAIVPASLAVLAHSQVVFRQLAASGYTSRLAVVCRKAWLQTEGAAAVLALAVQELQLLGQRLPA